MKYHIYAFLGIMLFLSGCSGSHKPSKEPMYQVVIPGDLKLRASRIKPHKVKYEKSGGFMTYVMNETEWEGRQIYELAIYFNTDESGTPDLIYIDKETLGYVGRRMEMPEYSLQVKFYQNKFQGELVPTEGSDIKRRTYNKVYPHNAFEPAVINYFITALPLKKGYKASLPVFDLNAGSQMYWANIEVIGKEQLDVGGRTFETWKVVSKGIKEKIIWVSTNEPYAIKMKTKGTWSTWELASY